MGRPRFRPILAQGTNDQLAGNTYVVGIGNPTGCLTITFTSGSGAEVEGDFAFRHQLRAALRGARARVQPDFTLATTGLVQERRLCYDGTDSYVQLRIC